MLVLPMLRFRRHFLRFLLKTWPAAVFSPSLHKLPAFGLAHIFPALAHVTAPEVPAGSAAPTAVCESAGEQAAQDQQAENLEKSEDWQAEKFGHQAVPQVHGQKGDGGNKEDAENDALGYPNCFYVFHVKNC